MSEQNSLNLEETGGVDSVEKYKFEPIKGYPMLHWHGKRPFTATQYYPAQKKEVYGEEVNGWINKIFWGDNLQVMSHLLKEYRGKVDLIYIDPPFDSKADYKKNIKLKGRTVDNDFSNFEEKQYTDIWTNDEYLQFIYERVVLLRELLSESGSIYLHCDWHKSHHIRCIMDEVFGPQNFLNEIVWKRASTVKGNFGQGAVGWGANTDTIFFYRKSDSAKFFPQFNPYRQEYIDTFYKYEDDDGRKYRLVSMIAPGGSGKGNPQYEVMGVTKYWRYSQEKMQRFIDLGLVVQTNPGTVPVRKQYLDDGKGVPIQTLWDDIEALGPSSNERLDYPTQKCEKLIERVVESATEKGDLVFDCFMGSGTTQAVAVKLGRRFLGADINLGAVQTSTKRLIKLREEVADQGVFGSDVNASFEVYNVNNYDVFRNPLEAKSLLMEALEIDSLSGSIYDGEKDGFMVKVMPVNRIATREDLNELTQNFPYKVFDQRKEDNPNKPVESIMLICMGHEPDLKAHLEQESGYKLNVEVVDVLRDKSNIEFKRESEAEFSISDAVLSIDNFYPMNLMQKLSLQKESVDEWRELVESVVIDWNYDGAAMEPTIVDLPSKNDHVDGVYPIPDDAGTIKIKITDLLSESYEEVIQHG